MQKILIAASLSLAAGFAVGAWLMNDDSESPATVAATGSVSNDTEARIRELEQSLAAERSARQLLEEQVDALSQQVESTNTTAAPQRQPDGDRLAAVTEQSNRPRNQAEMMASRMERMRVRRLEQFVEGGYTEDEALRLMEAESDAQLQAMHDQWEAQRNGEGDAWVSRFANPQDILRERLGDTEYERYLVAQGAPAAVQVASVMERSAGSIAGLQPGDEIVSYNGERTFSMMDLRRETFRGEPGETVLVEIDRDGVRMQLSMPSGPIGMNGSGGASNINWWAN